MKSICLYFQVHQPMRLRLYRFFDIGSDHHYYDDFLNRSVMQRVAEKCYLPANKLMLSLLKKHGKQLRISYSISGLALEQFEKYTPEVIDSFKKLADTGKVEFFAETYAHSLASLNNAEEFKRQVAQHSQTIERLFGYKPVTFRNTELIYSDEIGAMVYEMGYKTILTEGAKHVLGWKSPNYLYHHANNPGLKLLLKNFRLSDDIAFRFSNQGWSEWPLTADKYARWISQTDPEQEVINLFIDYETFGEHQWEETGIFSFLEVLPEKILQNTPFVFRTPSEIVKKHKPASEIYVPFPISWADEERDITAWLGNEMQDEAFSKLYSIADKVSACNDPDIQRDWLYLQASDHFYYMCTKWFSDGDVHRYFNPYPSPYEAFINYMNVLSDLMIRVEKCTGYDHKISNIIPGTPAEKRRTKRQAPSSVLSDPLEKLLSLSAARIKKTLKEAGTEVTAILLYGKEDDIRNKVFGYLTKTALKQLQETEKAMRKPGQQKIKKAMQSLDVLIGE